MPFKAHKIYEEYEKDKYKTSIQKKVEKALDTAEKEKLIPETKEVNIEFEEAREMFGKDFLGPEAVQTTFGTELTPEELQEVESIPFTREELEQAKQLGMMLVLRVPRVGKGETTEPLTIKQLRSVFEGEDKLGDPEDKKSQIFYNQSWYDNESFATQDTPKLGWGLVTKKILEESRRKDWDQQQEVLKKWAKENNIDPSLVRRRTPIEITYDTLIYYGVNKESLLEDEYDRTSVQSSGGDFVDVGDFGSGGLYVGGGHREYSHPSLGLCPAR